MFHRVASTEKSNRANSNVCTQQSTQYHEVRHDHSSFRIDSENHNMVGVQRTSEKSYGSVAYTVFSTHLSFCPEPTTSLIAIAPLSIKSDVGALKSS